MTSHNLAPGRLLGDGKYELIAPLGQGAMGWVWLARHVALGRKVAVKLLYSGLQWQESRLESRAQTLAGRPIANTRARNERASERFLKEARTASLLSHRNTVQLLDYGADGDDRWLVMEYLQGRNLADELHQTGPMPAGRAIGIVTQVLASLAEAHDHGIVHRDLKPANVMLVPWTDDDGREVELAKVLDFGIATMMSDEVADSGEVAGTPEYMSPEQAQALEVDQRSDVYAAGVLLYHLLTGDTPFSDPLPMNVMLAHVTELPRAPSELNPAISRELEALILQALAKSPGERPESARAFRTALLALPEARGLKPDSSPRLAPVSPPDTATAPQTRSAPRATANTPGSPSPLDPRVPPTRRRALVGLAAVTALAAATAGLVLAGVFDRPSESTELAELGSAAEMVSAATPMPAPAPAPAPTPTPAPTPAPAPAPMPTPALAPTPEPEPTPTPAPDPTPTSAPAPAPMPTPALAPTPEPEPTPTPAPDPTPTPAPDPTPASEPRPTPARTAARAPAPDPTPRPRPPAATPPAPTPTPTPTAVAPTPGPTTVGPTPTPTPTPTPASTAVAPTPTPTPAPPSSLSASAAITSFQSRGSLPRSTLLRAVDGARAGLEQCYATSARSAGRDLAGQLAANLVFDVDGKVASAEVGSYGLEGLAPCVRAALSRVRLRERPDTGSVDASFRIVFTPR